MEWAHPVFRQYLWLSCCQSAADKIVLVWKSSAVLVMLLTPSSLRQYDKGAHWEDSAECVTQSRFHNHTLKARGFFFLNPIPLGCSEKKAQLWRYFCLHFQRHFAFVLLSSRVRQTDCTVSEVLKESIGTFTYKIGSLVWEVLSHIPQNVFVFHSVGNVCTAQLSKHGMSRSYFPWVYKASFFYGSSTQSWWRS